MDCNPKGHRELDTTEQREKERGKVSNSIIIEKL